MDIVDDQFPKRPTCHDRRSLARYYPVEWRPPTDDYLPVRTCNYCGSIHPADLLQVLAAGATLHGSDWKYGWPHKFYVEGIPNPHAGEIRQCGTDSRSRPGDDQLSAEEIAEGWGVRDVYFGGVTIERPILAPASPTLTGKWYNEHLLDDGYEAAVLAALIDQIAQTTGIRFEIREATLYYRREIATA